MRSKWHREGGHGRWGPPWLEHGGPRQWPGHRGSRSKWLFLRFTMAFGFMVLFVVGGMATLAFLITRLFDGSGQTAFLVWIGGLGLIFGLPVLGVTFAMRAFRGIAVPLAGVMAAADSVAEGDLGTRVPESGRGASDGWPIRSTAWSQSLSARTSCVRTSQRTWLTSCVRRCM